MIINKISQWTTYVQGIPDQEIRRYLTNPFFAISEQLRVFFLCAFITKFSLQKITLLMLIFQLLAITDNWPLKGGCILAAVWLLVKCINTGVFLATVINQIWSLYKIYNESNSAWYRAEFRDQHGQQIAA